MKHTKPKMLVFSHICSPQYVTGAEKLLLFMVRELLPVFACTLVVPNEGVIAAGARSLDIPVIVQDIPLVVPLYLALPHLQEEIAQRQQEPSWQELLALLSREQPNVILVNTCVHPLPAIAGKALGIPVVWSIMEAIRDTPYRAAAAAVFEQHADFIVGISEAALEPLRTPGMIPRTKLVYPSWHQNELQPESWQEHRVNRRRQLGIEDHHRLVGYISSSIFEAKGLEHFMQMAVRNAVLHPKAMFLIVGNPVDQPYFEQCLDIARRLGLMERFRWLRFEEQVSTVYPAMDLLVVPSMAAEGFGMTALEGMVFGKATVVYGSGGLAEIGRMTGNADYVIQTGDYDGLAGKVSSLLSDDVALQAVGARSARGAHAAFGIAVYRERLRIFIDSLRLEGQTPKVLKGSGTAIYLFDQGKLRPFRTMEAFLGVGYRPEDVRIVPDAYIASWPIGEPIGQERPAPRGARLKRRKRGSKRLGKRLGKRRGGTKRRRGRTRTGSGKASGGTKKRRRKAS
ncbi:glycosyltransferase family 4 protein [Paenibacillus sacheonensis]|uniref:Glycosyltransferase n=1 Tax=Paenibacillus sacheonensis TaxID=742054 RepID=A0A7X4YSF6_9BACL|nr:glycosyltransferase family 4 protein [Paenibacillus sacheonensis]MBM7569278.1 glycosyltransferase involved in cell wall biosynthesis [Paenibacillus sacheonensis]NBC71712.1 glycosyltransferase [Paenibacillus sacheonensis]